MGRKAAIAIPALDQQMAHARFRELMPDRDISHSRQLPNSANQPLTDAATDTGKGTT